MCLVLGLSLMVAGHVQGAQYREGAGVLGGAVQGSRGTLFLRRRVLAAVGAQLTRPRQGSLLGLPTHAQGT